MRLQEQKLWDRMRHSLKDKVYMERVENVVNPGRPDVDVLWNGVVLPIELKAIEGWPVKASTAVLGGRGLNQNQLNWWLNWKRWGGFGFILVGVDGDIFAIPGTQSDLVNKMNSKELLSYRTSWPALVEQIKQEVTCLRNR